MVETRHFIPNYFSRSIYFTGFPRLLKTYLLVLNLGGIPRSVEWVHFRSLIWDRGSYLGLPFLTSYFAYSTYIPQSQMLDLKMQTRINTHGSYLSTTEWTPPVPNRASHVGQSCQDLG